MIIEQRSHDKHQNADSLSKKTEFYEGLEEKQANQAEIKDEFSFLDKETYDKLTLTRWLDKSGHPIPGHPELPVDSIALLNRTVNMAPDVMLKLRDLQDREVERHDHEWMETMQWLTITQRTRKGR